MTLRERDDDLLKAATTAAVTLDAIYQWLDRVDKAGGPTCLSGIAACKSMLDSLRKNKPRVESLIMAPLRDAISAREGKP
jgi:hypothetical protein